MSNEKDFIIENGVLKKYVGSEANVTIPDDGAVTALDDGAFALCEHLESVSIPPSVTSLGDECFLLCKNLKSVSLPDSVTELGRYCFAECTALTRIALPASLTFLRFRCFSGCTALQDVTIPARVTGLGQHCFEGCTALTRVTLPAALTSLGSFCFRNCAALVRITLPASVTSVGIQCFAECGALESIVVEKGNPVYHSAGNCVIESATGTLVAGCDRSVIPNDGSVRALGSYCFKGCTALARVEIPASVTELGDGWFEECGALESIVVEKVNPVYHSAGNCVIESATGKLVAGCNHSVIPDDGSVTALDDFCFAHCTALARVTVPASVTSLGYKCFAFCTALSDVTIPASVTSFGKGCFDFSPNVTLRVEKGSAAAKYAEENGIKAELI